MIVYQLHGINVTPYVIKQPKLKSSQGKISDLSASKTTLKLYDESGFLTPEKFQSFLCGLDYKDILLKIWDDDTNNLLWYGIVDDINYSLDDEIEIITTEYFIKLLEAETFQYKSDDGYEGNQSHAGVNNTPAEHLLAFLRRYIPEDAICVASFSAVQEIQENLSILIDCHITYNDKRKPIEFIKELCLGICNIYLSNNKIRLDAIEGDKGAYGVRLTDSVIINIENIGRTNTEKTYSRYSITDYTGTTHTGSVGDNGDADDLTGTYIEDVTANWIPSNLIGKYIEINNGSESKIFTISGNNKTRIYIDNPSLGASTNLSYIILENNNIYQKNFNTGEKIVLKSGADAIGATIITAYAKQKKEITLLVDADFLKNGDLINLNFPHKGIYNQTFKIEQVEGSLDAKKQN